MKTINEIINNAYMNFGSEDFIFEKVNGKYKSITYKKFILDTNSIADYLINKGYKDKIIMLWANNSTNYMKIDLAIMGYTGISAKISSKTSLEDVISTAKKIGCKTVLYDNKDNISNTSDIEFISFKELLDNVNYKEEINIDINRDTSECISIFFSSGTTSKPKGVMLNTKNIFWGWEPLQMRTPFTSNDIIYLFLPLNHTYANIYNFLYSLLSGLKIYLCSSLDKMSEEILEVNPTIICGVPLIYNRYAKASKDNLKYAFGNRIRFLYTGGAAIDKDIRRKYKDAGLNLLNAYALTETASSFSIDYPNDQVIDSVGTIFENIDVKIINADEEGIGDIVVKGGNVYIKYINDEEQTNISFTKDGYFITGDLGYIKDNHLYIKGRKDKILICSNGENINITKVESNLKKLSDKILKVTATILDDKINYSIYVENDFDIEPILKKYNSNTESYYNIKYYKILSKNDMTFKENV